MPAAKIHLKVQLAFGRDRAEPLALQIVRQLQEGINSGRIAGGTRLPSTRSFARTLEVSRNTVLTAYEELAARGLVRSRRGAGTYVRMTATVAGHDLRSVMREAQYPSRTIALQDEDGTPLYISY